MAKAKIFFRRLFSLRNMVPILIIAGALVGSLGLSPFGLKFTDQQVILALLGFLAIDALIERLDLLVGIEAKVDRIQEAVQSRINAENFFKKRSNFPRMELILGEARQEVWVCGVSFGTMATIQWDFSEKVKAGVRVRFMGIDPGGSCIPQLADYYNWKDCDDTIKAIRHNYSVLSDISGGKRKDSVQFRIIDQVLTTGYFIIDPRSKNAKMMVQLYQYHNNSQTSPLFVIDKENDPHWFSVLLEQYKTLWDRAKPYNLPAKPLPTQHEVN